MSSNSSSSGGGDLWGKLSGPTPVELSVESADGKIDKAGVRKKIWQFMEGNNIAQFPRPVYGRIPNFRGSAAAGERLADTEEFKAAKTVKVAADKAQDEIRFKTLESNKSLLVPSPGLNRGLLNRLTAEPGSVPEDLRKLASQKGIESVSKPVPMASRLKIDLFVVGSVAVDAVTGRRIGDGEGTSDLLWALAASAHSAAQKETVVATTVHDCQVFDSLPESLSFLPHEVPVDLIVTPTRVIRVSSDAKQKAGVERTEKIFWNLITKEKMQNIDLLKEIHHKEKSLGKDVKLFGEEHATNGHHENGSGSGNEDFTSRRKKNNNGDGESGGAEGSKKKRSNRKKKAKKEDGEKKGDATAGAAGPSDGDGEKTGKRTNRRNRDKKSANHDAKDKANQNGGEKEGGQSKDKKEGRNNRRNRQRRERGDGEGGRVEESAEDAEKRREREQRQRLTIFIGRLPRGAKSKELKDVLEEKGVALGRDGGASLVWKGFKGFAFLNVDPDRHSLSDLEERLRDLKLGDVELNVQTEQRPRSKRRSKSGEHGEEQKKTEGLEEKKPAKEGKKMEQDEEATKA